MVSRFQTKSSRAARSVESLVPAPPWFEVFSHCSIHFLGFVASIDGVEYTPSKVEVIDLLLYEKRAGRDSQPPGQGNVQRIHGSTSKKTYRRFNPPPGGNFTDAHLMPEPERFTSSATVRFRLTSSPPGAVVEEVVAGQHHQPQEEHLHRDGRRSRDRRVEATDNRGEKDTRHVATTNLAAQIDFNACAAQLHKLDHEPNRCSQQAPNSGPPKKSSEAIHDRVG